MLRAAAHQAPPAAVQPYQCDAATRENTERIQIAQITIVCLVFIIVRLQLQANVHRLAKLTMVFQRAQRAGTLEFFLNPTADACIVAHRAASISDNCLAGHGAALGLVCLPACDRASALVLCCAAQCVVPLLDAT